MLTLAAGAAVTLGGVAGSALGQTYTWVGPVSGAFSASANWQGGTLPVSSATTSLVFGAGNLSAAVTATDDLAAAPFQVNNLTFDEFMNPAFTVTSAAGKYFQMTGTNPSITLAGNNISNAVLNIFNGGGSAATLQLTSDLTINGSGMGGLTILGNGSTGTISDDFATSGVHRQVVISGTPATENSRVVQLNNYAGSFGGVTLNGGNIATAGFVSNGVLGPAGSTFTVGPNGGVFQQTQTTLVPTVDAFQLNGTLRLFLPSQLTINTTTQLLGSGALIVHPLTSVGMAVTSNSSSYTGTVTVDKPDLAEFSGLSVGGALSLTGASGALQGVSTFNIRAGGALLASNATANVAANSDRINNSATINLSSGALRVGGTSTTSTPTSNVCEVVGTINGAGASTLSAEPVANVNQSTVINVNGAVNRVDHGTFLFRGTSLGSGTLAVSGTNGDGSQNFSGGNVTGYVVLPAGKAADLVGGGGAATTTNISILPYAVGDITNTGSGTSFVTLDAISGSTSRNVRPLATSEYVANSVTSGDSTANVRLTAALANNGPATVNSLVIAANGSVDGSITGSGTLTVTSGAILAANANGTTSISNNVAFGAAEGVIYTPGFNGLTISGSLTGTQGLTKSGAISGSNNNTLFLTGDNSGLTGPLTINAGVINFNSAAALPGTGQITTNGTNVATGGSAVGLYYSGTTPYTLTRDVAANSGWTSFKALDPTSPNPGPNGKLTIAGAISGGAGISYQGTAGGAEIWVTGTSNTYTGQTRFGGGNIHVASDGSLGVGGAMEFDGGAMIAEGDISNSRHVNFGAGGSTIDTNGHNVTLNGPMTSFLANSLNNTPPGGFTKNGLGTLNLTSLSNSVTGAITVNGGVLLINGILGASTTNAVTVNAGATLGGAGVIYRNISVAASGNLSPGNGPGVLTVGGNMALASGSNLNMDLNGLNPGVDADQLVVSGAVTLTTS
jgi:autotransporter-associated beta strand protein